MIIGLIVAFLMGTVIMRVTQEALWAWNPNGIFGDESKDTEERVWTMKTYLHGKTPYYVELADYEDVLELHRLLCDLGHQIDDPPIAWVTENGSKNLWDFDPEEEIDLWDFDPLA